MQGRNREENGKRQQSQGALARELQKAAQRRQEGAGDQRGGGRIQKEFERQAYRGEEKTCREEHRKKEKRQQQCRARQGRVLPYTAPAAPGEQRNNEKKQDEQ